METEGRPPSLASPLPLPLPPPLPLLFSFDNAEAYEAGKAEEVMGAALKDLAWPRSSYVLSTKIYWGGPGPNDTGLSRKHILEGTRACLDRLGVEYVDLLFAHRPDPETPMEETVRAFNHCLDKGWALYWGTSEWSAAELADAWRSPDSLRSAAWRCRQRRLISCLNYSIHNPRQWPLYVRLEMKSHESDQSIPC